METATNPKASDGRSNMSGAELDRRIERVAALGEPARRALYRYVAAQAEPVTREQAAGAVGVAHHVAKFHLDRLVADGLLDADYRRPPGRGGPGAGRPAKVYRAVADLDVTVPERRYDLAGRLLVRALGRAQRTGVPVTAALDDVARHEGHDLARAPESQTGPAASPADRAVAVLEFVGFEPMRSGHEVLLHNCPFHLLAEEERGLVCSMNLSLVRGVLEAAGASAATATLDPRPGSCCVRVTLD